MTSQTNEAAEQAERRQRAALSWLILGACMIGLSPIFVRWSQVGPVSTAFFRILFALPLFALFGFYEARRISPANTSAEEKTARAPWGWIGLGGVGLALDLSLWHMSLEHISVVNATLFANLAPIFVTLAAWGVLGEKIGLRFVLGLFLSIMGACVLVLASRNNAPQMTDGNLWLGVAQGLGAAFFYALYILCMKMSMTSDFRRVGLGMTMFCCGLATLMALVPLLLISGESPLSSDLLGWGVLLALAWLPQSLGQGLIVKGLGVLPASFSSLTLLIQPVVAALLAWVLLSEALGWFEVLGACMVLLGVFLAKK